MGRPSLCRRCSVLPTLSSSLDFSIVGASVPPRSGRDESRRMYGNIGVHLAQGALQATKKQGLQLPKGQIPVCLQNTRVKLSLRPECHLHQLGLTGTGVVGDTLDMEDESMTQKRMWRCSTLLSGKREIESRRR